MVKTTFNKMVNKYSNSPTLIIILLLLIVLLFIIIIIYLVKIAKTREYFESSKDKTFVYCYMDGCPHCESTHPEWENLEQSWDNNNIELRKVENKEDPELMRKHDVKGFPTFLMLDKNGNKIDEYNGERNIEGFNNFLKFN